MSPAELAREIKAGRFKAVYYFCGAADYRIKEAKKALAGHFLPKAQHATNRVILSAAKSRIEDILTELSMIPMLGERQLFIIENIQSLTQKQIEKIISLLKPPDPNRVVIFSSPSLKIPNKKTKLFNYLQANTTLVDFPQITGRSAHEKIRALLKNKGVEIEPEAINMLADLSGGDMGAIIGEVNKLIDFAGDRKLISADEVASVSSDYQAFKVFELAGCAAMGQFDKALGIVKYFIRKGERLTGLMFWLGEHFIGLYLAKNGKKTPGSKRDMSWKYKGQLHLFENEQLERIIHLIADADYDLRRNIRPEQLVIEKLIFEICSLSGKDSHA